MTAGHTNFAPEANERLTATLFVAVLAHLVVVLGVTFSVAPEASVPLQGLDVRLVPEAGDEPRSAEAAYLAEFDRVGRGTTTERIRAVTPRGLESRATRDAVDSPGQPISDGIKSRDAVIAVTIRDPAPRYVGPPTNSPLETGARALLREQTAASPAELETGGDDAIDRARLTGPASREGELVSPDTQAAAFAPYLDRWRRKVERFGTLNFPNVGAARHFRPPVLEVLLGADGRVRSITVLRTSGEATLDQAAMQIVRGAGQFEPFPTALARSIRELRFAYEWRFETPTDTAGGRTP